MTMTALCESREIAQVQVDLFLPKKRATWKAFQVAFRDEVTQQTNHASTERQYVPAAFV
jgi:hypothetical protein